MAIDFDALLQREESTKLDFKRSIGFKGGTEHQRGEILKDLIAMANTQPDEPGYLIYGIKKEPAKLPQIEGIRADDVVDTADLTQFISSNTNRPITFYADYYTKDAKTVVALIVIPDGEIRYATKAIGKTKPNIVYYRDNDSTAEMTPDAITARAIHRNQPKLSLEIIAIDKTSQQPVEIGSGILLKNFIRRDQYIEMLAQRALSTKGRLSNRVDLSPEQLAAWEALIDPPEQRAAREAFEALLPKVPPDFENLFTEPHEQQRQFITQRFDYMCHMGLLQKVHILIQNHGKCLASHCKVHLIIPNPDGTVRFETEDTLPQEPPTMLSGGGVFHGFRMPRNAAIKGVVRMTSSEGEYAVSLSIGSIQAGNHSVSEGFYIGSSATQSVTMKYTIFFDEPGGPLRGQTTLPMHVEDTSITDVEIREASRGKQN